MLIAYKDPISGGLEDGDGNPVNLDDHGADQLIAFSKTLVMSRQQAEDENYEMSMSTRTLPLAAISSKWSTHQVDGISRFCSSSTRQTLAGGIQNDFSEPPSLTYYLHIATLFYHDTFYIVFGHFDYLLIRIFIH